MIFPELKKELDNGKVRSLYIFTGEEKGVMQKYLQRLGVTADYPDLSLALPVITSKGLFNVKKCICVSGGFDDFDYKTLHGLSCGNCVVLLAKSIDMRKKFYKDATKSIVEFKRFTSEQLAGYVKKQLKTVAVENDDIYYLISELCHNEVLRIDNECDKLYNLFYIKDTAEVITLPIIYEIISPYVEDRIFELADAIIKKEAKLAYTLIQQLRSLKVAEVKMIVVIYGRFQQVLLVQNHENKNDFDIAKITQINAWAVKMCRPLVHIRSNKYLAQGLKKIYQCEFGVKTGQAPADKLFNHLVYRLLKDDC